MILALIFLIGMAILVTAMADRTLNQANHVTAYVEFLDTLQGLESGFSMAQAELMGEAGSGPSDQDGFVGVDPTYLLMGPSPTFGHALVSPVELTSMPGTEFFAISYDWSADGLDNNGDGNVDDATESDYFSILAGARGEGGTVRRAEVILNGANVNVWQNAIFAGGRQAGNLINGNVSVHGSVHLLGDNLLAGDIAMSLSGTSGVYNNYDGLPAALEDRIPALDTTVVEGETVETLKAKLRVKNGLVGLSGTSTIGEPQQMANASKEMMKGIYVTDGWTGNQLDAEGNPQQAYSDNGFNEPYDLSGAVPFPTFTDDGGADYLQYYLEKDADPAVGLQEVHIGDIAVTANNNYFWNATTGAEAVNTAVGQLNMPNLIDLDYDEYFVWFDATSNLMVINGRVPVDGNVSFDKGNGNDKTIYYTGKGTILAFDADGSGNGGNVAVYVHLLTQNSDGTTTNSFPTNSLIGLMAGGDMVIGSTSQLQVMGGFYAQGLITVNKQTIITGTLVGNDFDMGMNVPEIYQVPLLADEWLEYMRMIGAQPVQYFERVAWRELGVF